MTSEADEDAAAVRFPPPLVPLAAILIGVGLNALWPIDPGFSLAAPLRYWAGGLIIAASLIGLGLWPVILFRRSGQSEIPWKPTPSILETGPYRFTRNPMYLMMLLVCIGVAVMLMNAWIVVLTPACAWLIQRIAILPEEAYLERKFGENYRAYKTRVRRWI